MPYPASFKKRNSELFEFGGKLNYRLSVNARIFRLLPKQQINNFMQIFVEVWSTGNEENMQGICDKWCATEIIILFSKTIYLELPILNSKEAFTAQAVCSLSVQ